MDALTRAELVRACRVEIKQTRRQQRRRRAGENSAYATDQAMGERRPPFPAYRPRSPDTAPGPDPDLQARIDRRIARSRRGRAVRNVPLTRLIDLPNPTRPDYDRAHTGITPRLSRAVGERIRQRVPRNARARPEVIHHGLTPDQILAREQRINRSRRRKEREQRRLVRYAPHIALAATRRHERGGRH